MRPRGRALQVVDSLQGGGAKQHAVDLALALRQQGCELVSACSVVGPAQHTFTRMVDVVERAYGEAVAHRFGTPLHDSAVARDGVSCVPTRPAPRVTTGRS